jgi:hypothetical protein
MDCVCNESPKLNKSFYAHTLCMFHTTCKSFIKIQVAAYLPFLGCECVLFRTIHPVYGIHRILIELNYPIRISVFFWTNLSLWLRVMNHIWQTYKTES